MANMDGGSALWEGGIGGGGGGGGGDGSGRVGDGVRQSSKTKVGGLHDSSPPPFLTKTFEMVNDPHTNHIISWSHSGTSFIVWDHLTLASDILPRFFRHSNFSSFVYQLNNYGFRKIGLQKWEYENAWFQAGKKHLLINIKSRHHKLKRMIQRGSQECCQYEMKEELDSLRNGQNMITAEMNKLKQMQEDMQSQISAFKKHAKMVDTKSKEELMILAKAMNKVMMKQVLKYIGEGKKQKLDLQETGEMSKSGEGKDEIIEVNTSESSESSAAETGKKNVEEHQKTEVKLDDLMISKMIMDEAEDMIAKTTSLEEEEEVVVVNIEL